jgi:hypothetical protein
VEAATPATVQRANELVQENQRIILDEICAELNVSHGPAHAKVHDKLLYRKVCARWIQMQLKELKFDVLQHPPYSPDLAPSDFYIFGPLKCALRGRKFRDDTDAQNAVHIWLRSLPKHFSVMELETSSVAG